MALLEITGQGYDHLDTLEVQKQPVLTELNAFLEAQTDITQEGVWHRLGTDSHDPGCPSAILSAKYTTSGDNVTGEPNQTIYHLDLLEDKGRTQTSLVICEGQAAAIQYTITAGGLLLLASELGAFETADALARVAQVVDEGTVKEDLETLRESHWNIENALLKAGLKYAECKSTLPEGPNFTHTRIKEAWIQAKNTEAGLWLPQEHVRDRSTETPLVGRMLAGVAITSSPTS